MKEILVLTFGAAQSLLIWIILRLRDKVSTLEKENTQLADLILSWVRMEMESGENDN